MNEAKLTPRFPIGDIVQLRSGGPLMTVTGLPGDQDHDRTCAWRVKEELPVPVLPGFVLVTYFNPISGMFEFRTFPQDCLRGGTTHPTAPEIFRELTSTPKSSLA